MLMTWHSGSVSIRPCPYDTFPNRSLAACVHTGETGTSVPVSRDHLAIWNEQAGTVRDRSHSVDFVV